MKILIVSDSHGNNGPLRAAIMKEAPDMLIHLGDAEYSQSEIARWAGAPKTPCIFVRGNCDTYCDPDLVRNSAVFTLNGHKIFCSHGHLQKVNYGLLTLSLTAQENGCDICMFGHTHVPYDSFGDAVSEYNRFYESGFGESFSGPRILNPGSVTLPRGGSARSYMIMDMEDDGRYDVRYCLCD